MKQLLLIGFSFLCCTAFAQQTQYYRQLKNNHVSPYLDIVGIYPIDSLTASTTSHYVFRYTDKKQLVEIVNHHYFTEKVHPLASLGAYKIAFTYAEQKEIRTFFDVNGQRMTNERGVFKEVYDLDRKGRRKQLRFFDLEHKPMESNWHIAVYQWKKHRRLIVEKRYNLKQEAVNLSPYFEFKTTGILLNRKGEPSVHYNLNAALKISENSHGIASYKDVYDARGNHLSYSYHDQKGALVLTPFGYAVCEKKYDGLGNRIEQRYFDTDHQLVNTRSFYSNASITLSPKASAKDSTQIREVSLGYLTALQQLKPALMARVMSDDLHKVHITHDPTLNKAYLRATSKKQMIAYATDWNKTGTKFPFKPSNLVVLLDVYDNIATVKLISDNWVEYLHLAKIDGHWKIANLLWQYKDIERDAQMNSAVPPPPRPTTTN